MIDSISVAGGVKDPSVDPDSTFVGKHSVISVTPTGRRLHRLRQIKGPGAPKEFELRLEETVIGRSAKAHICIESNLISRQHVAMRRQGQVIQVQDLESSNGVFLNGVRAHAATLHEGDTIQIGDVLFVYHEGE